jgi:hypothetical protein
MGDGPAVLAPPPPLPHVPRRRGSATMAIGIVLGLVGVGAVVAFVLLQVAPHNDSNAVPGLQLSAVLPASSLAPTAGPDPDAPPDAGGVDAGARTRHFKKRPRK